MRLSRLPSPLFTALLSSALLLTASACDGDDGETSTTDDSEETEGDTEEDPMGTTTESAPECTMDADCGGGEVCSSGACVPDASNWAVGDAGTVLRVSPDGGQQHPLGLDVDIHAITCHGLTMAWFVGEGGVVGFTDDAGDSWTTEVITSATLRDVAATEPLRVAAVGDDGALLISDNGGAFQAIAGASGTLRGVDVSPFRVIAVAEDGVIWRHEAGDPAAAQTGVAAAALHAVDFGDHGPYGAAVGAAGTMLWSDDGGVSWTPQARPTDADLFAVQVSMNGDAWVAVGQDGVVVRKDSSNEIAVEHPVAVDLLALHLSTGGHGTIVGRQGAALRTTDAARTVTPIATGVTVDITGVDAVGDLHW